MIVTKPCNLGFPILNYRTIRGSSVANPRLNSFLKGSPANCYMPKPSIDDLGRDLLHVSKIKILFALSLPFLLLTAYFLIAVNAGLLFAIPCLVALDFFTYGSVSHDLVHRNYKLPHWLNHLLLSVIELLCLRSGHAYLKAHLHHHRRFPHEDDIEGHASKLGFIGALLHGVLFQHRILIWALKKDASHKTWIVFEGVILYSIMAAAAILAFGYPVFTVYVILIHVGGWIIPLMTSYIPHDASGNDEISQTRLFRGKFFSIIALDHLYHLEHHLYPQVPHQNWAKLARRLDPFFKEKGLRSKKFPF